ncbi:Phage integrase [Desulfovibrio sp. DV]|uniref:tyrosine-type recombinase/integrase n=1 Tax=Desulfovibrio sp. DV TaxID=1844708 RepID=UPI00094BA371|nr:site-specific integrase [Desulfovibrio sp. DV]OLN24888.1 Phage integrase [Desulfovibrio sp. DV]
MAGKYIKTRFRGVYYRESPTRKCSYGADRCYVVWHKDAAGKAHWHTVGWHSDGIRPAYADEIRKQLMTSAAPSSAAVPVQETTPPATYTVGDAVARYLGWAVGEGKHVAPEQARYDKHLKARLDAVPLDSVNLQMLWDIKAALRTTMAPQTVRHCFSLLRRSVNHTLEIEAWKGDNPFAIKRHSSFKLPRADNQATRYLTRHEARALLAALRPRSQQVHDMAALSLRTGLRATEIFGIHTQDLDLDGHVIHIRAKGGDAQSVPAPADLMQILAGYQRQPHETVFQDDAGGPITWGISYTFDRVVNELKLNDGVTDKRRRVRFHTLRHTFASWLAQSGQVTLQELMEMMRHKRIEMTLRYAHLIPGGGRRKLTIIDQALLDPDHDD